MSPRALPENWDEVSAELGDRVRSWRESRSMTQEQLALASGVSRNQIQNIENSRNNARAVDGRRTPGPANPHIATLWPIAVVLGVEIADLVPRIKQDDGDDHAFPRS